jgi:glycosyltransferase involved in cell wall biosynthesis
MPNEFRTRASLGLPSFYMSERWWKPPLGRIRLLHPRFLKTFLQFRSLSKSPHLWFLPIGERAAGDLSRLLGFGMRQRRWGYFPETPIGAHKIDERAVTRILWAGRFISWKRVDTLVRAYRKVLDMGCNCELELIGDGPTRGSIQELISNLSLTKHVIVQPALAHSQVFDRMRLSEIYVFPSLAHEGWGAVVNEAMAAGCVVLASAESGAGGSLVKDGYNGYLVDDSSVASLATKLAFIVRNIRHLRRIRYQAIKTIEIDWSAKVAAERFYDFAVAVRRGMSHPIWQQGAMSVING